MHKRMQNCIGYICLTFRHCVFSYVSLDGLPDKRHIHIGCIYMIFLHCVFSNVSSNCMPVRMHSHIGCIYLTFLQCPFSNPIYEKGHIQIYNICSVTEHIQYSRIVRIEFSLTGQDRTSGACKNVTAR